jgi:hypothetical protein
VENSIKEISLNQLEKVYRGIGLFLEKAKDDQGRKINAIEEGLTDFLSDEHIKLSDAGIKSALNSFAKTERPFTKTDGKKVESILEKSFDKIGIKTSSRVNKDLKEIYSLSKERFAKNFKLDKKLNLLLFKSNGYLRIVDSWDRKTIVKQTLGESDLRIIAELERLANVAIGDHYPKTLKPRVSRLIQNDIIEKGLNKTQAGEILEVELTRKLGSTIKAVPEVVRQQGANATRAYFKGLAQTNSTMARSFSSLNLMREAEITRFVFDAIIDELTSDICAQMNGRVFEIDMGIEQMNKMLESENVEDLKSVAPFTRDLSAFNLSRGEKLTDRDAMDALAKAGVMIPPLHFRCRSALNPA